jgi:hypothetical protein
MPYVEREAGIIVGQFEHPQPGRAEEWIAPDHADLGAIKRRAIRRLIDAERDRRIAAGCVVQVPGIGGVPLQGRQQDKDNLQGLVTAAQLRLGQGDTTTTTPFRDAENVVGDLTPMQIVALWQGGSSYISAVYQASWAIKDSDPMPEDFAAAALWPAPVWPQP